MTESSIAASIRDEFPVMRELLYLDSAHQAPMANCVREALTLFLEQSNRHAGPKSQWLTRVDRVRSRLATLLNATPGEIAFTKNTSEGLNIAANSLALKPGDQVLMLGGDHPNNTYAWLNLRRKGVEVRFVDLPDSQAADAQTFEPHIEPQTKVISLSHISFHAGQRHDIESIGRLCEQKGIYLILDAMQSVGVVPIDVKRLGVSVLAAGCHKGLLVPQGMGFLYVKETLQELQPPFLAMASLARPPEDYIARPDDVVTRADAGRFEIGNYNLPDLFGLESSLDLLRDCGVQAIEQHVLSLGDRLISGLSRLGVELVGPISRACRAHIYVLALLVQPWVDYLSDHNVRVSPERGGVRVSFGLFNSIEDVERLLFLIEQRLQKS